MHLTADQWIGVAGAVGALLAAIVPLIFFLIERKDRKAADAARDLAEQARQELEVRYRDEESERGRRELELAERRLEEERERYIGQQADQIHAWVQTNDDPREPSGEPHERISIEFLNASTGLVTGLEITYQVWDLNPDISQEELVPGSRVVTDWIELLPPGRLTFKLTPLTAGWSFFDCALLRLELVDSRGVRWERRFPDGPLKRIGEGVAPV